MTSLLLHRGQGSPGRSVVEGISGRGGMLDAGRPRFLLIILSDGGAFRTGPVVVRMVPDDSHAMIVANLPGGTTVAPKAGKSRHEAREEQMRQATAESLDLEAKVLGFVDKQGRADAKALIAAMNPKQLGQVYPCRWQPEGRDRTRSESNEIELQGRVLRVLAFHGEMDAAVWFVKGATFEKIDRWTEGDVYGFRARRELAWRLFIAGRKIMLNRFANTGVMGNKEIAPLLLQLRAALPEQYGTRGIAKTPNDKDVNDDAKELLMREGEKHQQVVEETAHDNPDMSLNDMLMRYGEAAGDNVVEQAAAIAAKAEEEE